MFHSQFLPKQSVDLQDSIRVTGLSDRLPRPADENLLPTTLYLQHTQILEKKMEKIPT